MSDYRSNTYGATKDYKLLSFDDILAKRSPFLKALRVDNVQQALQTHREDILDAYHNSGAILLRGDASWLEGGPAKTETLLNTIGDILKQDFFSYKGGHAVRGEPLAKGTHIFQSTYATPVTVIPQHNEMSFTNHLPKTITFLCSKVAEKNGQTPLTRNADLSHIFDDGDRTRLRKLVLRGVAFNKSNATFAELLEKLKPHVPEIHHLAFDFDTVFGTSDPDVIEKHYESMGIPYEWYDENRDLIKYANHTTAHLDDPLSGEEVYFSQFHYNGIVGKAALGLLVEICEEKLIRFMQNCGATLQEAPIPDTLISKINDALDIETVMFDWQAGDVLIINNLLVMHGRNSYEGERELFTSLFGDVDRSALVS